MLLLESIILGIELSRGRVLEITKDNFVAKNRPSDLCPLDEVKVISISVLVTVWFGWRHQLQ